MVKDAVVRVRLDTRQAESQLRDLEREAGDVGRDQGRREERRRETAEPVKAEKPKGTRFAFIGGATRKLVGAAAGVGLAIALKPLIEELIFEQLKFADKILQDLGLVTQSQLQKSAQDLRDFIAEKTTQFTSKIAAIQQTRSSLRAMEIAGANPTAAEAADLFDAFSATEHQRQFLQNKLNRIEGRQVQQALLRQMRSVLSGTFNP